MSARKRARQDEAAAEKKKAATAAVAAKSKSAKQAERLQKLHAEFDISDDPLTAIAQVQVVIAAKRAAVMTDMRTLRTLSRGLEGMFRAALAKKAEGKAAEGKIKKRSPEDDEPEEDDDPDDFESKADGIAIQADEFGEMLATIEVHRVMGAHPREGGI